jgi:hypothetical protein
MPKLQPPELKKFMDKKLSRECVIQQTKLHLIKLIHLEYAEFTPVAPPLMLQLF